MAPRAPQVLLVLLELTVLMALLVLLALRVLLVRQESRMHLLPNRSLV